VVAGKIAAGAIGATEIAVGAIRAQHILVAPKSLNPDPSFETVATGWTGFVRRLAHNNVAVPAGCPVPFAAEFSARDNPYVTRIDVAPGEVYRMSVWVNRGTGSGGLGIGGYGAVFNAAGTGIAFFQWPGVATTAAGWVRLSGVYTIPANGARLSFGPWADRAAYTGEAWYADLNIEKVNDASLIVDGSIIASKMAVNSITAANGALDNLSVATAKIQDLAVETAKIANLAVNNAKIADLAVDNAKIANATIQDAKIVALDAAKITTGFLAAARIQAGSITAEKITLGASGATTNILRNSDWNELNGVANNNALCLKEWVYGVNGIAGVSGYRNFDSGRVWNVGNGGMYLYDNTNIGDPVANQYIYQTVAATPGQVYEASVFMSVHRCAGYIFVEWLNSGLTPISSNGPASMDAVLGILGGSGGPSQMQRLWLTATAPAGTAHARFFIVKNVTNTGGADSYMFAHRAMLNAAPVDASATNQTAWNDGGMTTIHGGSIVADTITANLIVSNSVTEFSYDEWSADNGTWTFIDVVMARAGRLMVDVKVGFNGAGWAAGNSEIRVGIGFQPGVQQSVSWTTTGFGQAYMNRAAGGSVSAGTHRVWIYHYNSISVGYFNAITATVLRSYR
jgi:hypothetical protein